MSRIAAWWSPGLREKRQKETAAAGRLADIHTLSMGDLPAECLA